jgi:hypothetical protein
LEGTGKPFHYPQVDVYHVSVHGQFKGMAAELVGALRPTVAIMGNGARKGGDPQTWPILRAAPGLQDICQIHYSELGTAETNPPPDFIANLQGPTDEHQLIKLSVSPDGTYTVTNTRNGCSKTYHAAIAQGKVRDDVQPSDIFTWREHRHDDSHFRLHGGCVVGVHGSPGTGAKSQRGGQAARIHGVEG